MSDPLTAEQDGPCRDHEFRPIDSSGQLVCVKCNERYVVPAKPPLLHIPPDTAWAIEKFTKAQVEQAAAGAGTRVQWEEIRSYAYESLVGLLRANPEQFTYTARMRAEVAKKRQEKQRGTA